MNRPVGLGLVGIVGLAVGCGGDLDPPWQLDHDRIVAVRASRPSVVAGARSELDGLLAFKGAKTVEQVPEGVVVVSPQSLAGAVTQDLGQWIVTAPDEPTLAAARSELGLPADSPVPLQLGVSYADQTLVALKTIRLGTAADNPTLAAPVIGGAPAPATDIVILVGKLVDVPLAIEVAETDEVTWLTSCGTLHDFDLPEAYLRVEPDDPTEGELALVVRDDHGGVTWRVWQIRAE
ncbi:MAG: hypothetical protein H6Q90_2771 [Deltaproteobacteria bacterium]|nr:hypothetical protein [Deltaproteobacteria bacterium]